MPLTPNELQLVLDAIKAVRDDNKVFHDDLRRAHERIDALPCKVCAIPPKNGGGSGFWRAVGTFFGFRK